MHDRFFLVLLFVTIVCAILWMSSATLERHRFPVFIFCNLYFCYIFRMQSATVKRHRLFVVGHFYLLIFSRCNRQPLKTPPVPFLFIFCRFFLRMYSVTVKRHWFFLVFRYRLHLSAIFSSCILGISRPPFNATGSSLLFFYLPPFFQDVIGNQSYEVSLNWAHMSGHGTKDELSLSSICREKGEEVIATRSLHNDGNSMVLTQTVRRPAEGYEVQAKHFFKRVMDKSELRNNVRESSSSVVTVVRRKKKC